MKFPGEAAERVARTLLRLGPSTASDLADELDLTPAAVRRVLTVLMDADLVVARDRAPYGPAPKRGRGRPSSVFSLTPAGHAACDDSHAELALDALRFLAAEYGPAAVAAFANTRAERLVGGLLPSRPATPAQVAAALTQAGYAADVSQLDTVAVQLCQHHCPVVDVAREFPAMCEAETEALGRALGTHVTRLATLAHGDEVCTAVIPLTVHTHVDDDSLASTGKVRL